MNSQGCLLSIYLAQGMQDILNTNLQCGLTYLTVLPLPVTPSLLQENQKEEDKHKLPEAPLQSLNTWDSRCMEESHLEG